MYEKKQKINFIIAVVYWIITMIGLFFMGILFKNGYVHYNIIYYGLVITAVLIVLIKDKKLTNLGFTKEKIKINAIIAVSIVFAVFIASIFISDYPVKKLLIGVVYYLVYIAAFEEIIYRGFLQNYLFGLNANKYVIYLIGALMFSLMHLPFQMYVNNNVSFHYIIIALPQLFFTALFHLLCCFITYKRKDILIPIAIHFVIDYISLMQ